MTTGGRLRFWSGAGRAFLSRSFSAYFGGASCCSRGYNRELNKKRRFWRKTSVRRLSMLAEGVLSSAHRSQRVTRARAGFFRSTEPRPAGPCPRGHRKACRSCAHLRGGLMEPGRLRGGRARGCQFPGTGLLGGCLQPPHRRCVGLLLRPWPLPSAVRGKKLHVSSRQVTRCSPGENDLVLLAGPATYLLLSLSSLACCAGIYLFIFQNDFFFF